MKIISVNLKIETLKKIENLVGDEKLYASRSELVRVALRVFFKEQIELAREVKCKMIETVSDRLEGVEKAKVLYKTYKILREA